MHFPSLVTDDLKLLLLVELTVKHLSLVQVQLWALAPLEAIWKILWWHFVTEITSIIAPFAVGHRVALCFPWAKSWNNIKGVCWTHCLGLIPSYTAQLLYLQSSTWCTEKPPTMLMCHVLERQPFPNPFPAFLCIRRPQMQPLSCESLQGLILSL